MAINFGRSAPMSHGIEIEQMEGDLPTGFRNNGWNWHRDPSGPQETDIGPQKFVKSLLSEFYDHTRDGVGTWEWKAASSTTAGTQGTGCGSHVHFHLEVPDDADREEHVTAWTVGYNTLVELTPIFAPFFIHDWEQGLRHGTTYTAHGQTNGARWASAQTRRLSTSSMSQYVDNPNRPVRDTSEAVTINSADNSKPLTVEVRMSDAHPAMSLTGSTFLRCLVRRCIEAGWSPKLDFEAMGFSSHSNAMESMYDAIHPTHSRSLLHSMKETGEVIFQEGRGVPGVDRRKFSSMFDALDAMLTSLSTDTGTYANRVKRLVKTGRADLGPQNQPRALWYLDAEKGEFEWDVGPEMP